MRLPGPTAFPHRRRLRAALGAFGVAAAAFGFAPAPAEAQTARAIPLSFHDFRPGMTVNEVTLLVRRLGGTFGCETSVRDRRVQECRGRASGPDLGGPVSLWGSAMNGVMGVLTVAGDLEADQLDAWRAHLERQHGEVDVRVQGRQWMLQWVRRGTMVRLTWRIGGGERRASVSLVHGPTLDEWAGARRQAARPATPTPPPI